MQLEKSSNTQHTIIHIYQIEALWISALMEKKKKRTCNVHVEHLYVKGPF